MPMVSEGAKLRAELNLLVLRRAEGDLLFWGTLWEDISCAWKLNAVQLRFKECAMAGSSSIVLRKAVPIRDIIKRIMESPPQQEKLATVLGRSDLGVEVEMEEETF